MFPIIALHLKEGGGDEVHVLCGTDLRGYDLKFMDKLKCATVSGVLVMVS